MKARDFDGLAQLQRELRCMTPALSGVGPDTDIRAWRRRFVDCLRRTWMLPPHAPAAPKAEILTRSRRSGYELQRIVLTGRHGPVPGYLLLPDRPVNEPSPAVLCMHGNVPGAAAEVAGEDRRRVVRDALKLFHDDYARRLTRQGVTCLVIDQPLQGDRAPRAPAGRKPDAFDAAVAALLTVGRPYLGECLADQQLALDYLLARPDVDPKRVGVMGFSMGGTLSAALAVVDRRPRCAMFSGYVPSWRERLAAQSSPQALLAYVPDMLRWFDMPDILAAVAPLPLIVAAEARGKIAAERKWLRPIRAGYRAWNAERSLRVWRPPVGPHRFHPEPCLNWFLETLCGTRSGR